VAGEARGGGLNIRKKEEEAGIRATGEIILGNSSFKTSEGRAKWGGGKREGRRPICEEQRYHQNKGAIRKRPGRSGSHGELGSGKKEKSRGRMNLSGRWIFVF